MTKVLLAIALFTLSVNSATADVLTPAEAELLRSDVAVLTTSFEQGDAEALIKATHPSLHRLAGGQEVFGQITRQAVEQLRQSGLRFVSAEVGEPTRTYQAGDEEVCFVPRISIMEFEGRELRSTTFMIAIRRIGDTGWKYLDGAGLRDHPELLYQLLPELERGISLPLNLMEPL